MNEILIAVLIVSGIGLVCGIILAVVSVFTEVKVDETVEKLRACLPGANCGACGYTGCDGYAKALKEGAKTNLCVPGADAVAKEIADILGVEAEDVVEQVAIVKCNGNCNATSKKYDYQGVTSCAAVKTLYGGSGACAYGCLGQGDCVNVCPHNAIRIENGVALINPDECVGCSLCAKTCPNKIIEMIPDIHRVAVRCSNKQKGADTRKVCTNGCIGCKKCELNCPTKAIKVTNNLASVDYNLCIICGKCAEVCPVKCVDWADFSGKHRQNEEK
ncbi:MAG: RnfABCDGE type electron transport complex subunit B [Clostridia bacterium]|nr:RnfABCDGE type electron transport complex subunit B [Clostridia bacterium]